jgi:hypothetical protein
VARAVAEIDGYDWLAIGLSRGDDFGSLHMTISHDLDAAHAKGLREVLQMALKIAEAERSAAKSTRSATGFVLYASAVCFVVLLLTGFR